MRKGGYGRNWAMDGNLHLKVGNRFVGEVGKDESGSFGRIVNAGFYDRFGKFD